MSRSVRIRKENKKKKRNKIIAISLIAVGLISTVAVIIMAALGVFDTGEVKPIRSSLEDRRVVGEIDGHKVRYEELKYVTYVIKQQYREKYGQDVWDSEESAAKYRDQLEADVISTLKTIYSTLVICDEVGVKENNKDAKEYTQAQIEKYVTENYRGDFEAYKSDIASSNLTDAAMRFAEKIEYLDFQAKSSMISDKNRLLYSKENAQEFIDYVLSSDDYSRIYYVIFNKNDNAGTDASGKAAAMAEHLRSIEDTDERYKEMREYISKSTTFISTNGQYVVDGTMGEEFDAAVDSIDIYGVAVAETEGEYFVMMKMPKEESHVRGGFDDMLASYQEIAYTKYKNEVIDRIEFVSNKYYDSLDLVNIVD